MSENQPVKKRDMPLSMLLLAVHVVLNWRRLPGLLNFSTDIPTGVVGTVTLGAGGVIGILSYLANAAVTLIPIALLVLVSLFAMKDKPVRKAASLLCIVLGIAFIVIFGISVYTNFIIIQSDFYGFFPHAGDVAALLVYGLGMIQIGSKLSKDTLRPKMRSYGILFYYLMLAIAIFVIMPAFMDMTISISAGNILGNIMLIAAGFYLPATLLEEGKKSTPVNIVNLFVSVLAVIVILSFGGRIGYSSYADSHQMPGVTTVTCPVCHKKFTDKGNKDSIAYSNMCKSCRTSYKATKDALGW